MRLVGMSASILILVFLVGCGELAGKTAAGKQTSAPKLTYPKSAEEVTNSDEYRLVFTGKKSGIEYYVRVIEALNDVPDELLDCTLNAPNGEGVWMYVPIKEGAIVAPFDDDITAMVITEGMKDLEEELKKQEQSAKDRKKKKKESTGEAESKDEADQSQQ